MLKFITKFQLIDKNFVVEWEDKIKKLKHIKPTHLEKNFFPIKYKQKEEIIVVRNCRIITVFKFNFKNITTTIKKCSLVLQYLSLKNQIS